MHSKLRIGIINYANVFPIYYSLKSQCDLSGYEFIEAYPSSLNKMLKDGEIDLGICSSIEYLRHKDDYIFIEGHSIGSDGPIKSIALISRVHIKMLDSQEIFVTHQSETSPVLLGIILKKFYGISAKLIVTDAPFYDAIRNHSAYLSIGDDALRTTLNSASLIPVSKSQEFELISVENDAFYFYDLGSLWNLYTGLPFVFALWTLRKKSIESKGELFERFKKDLLIARQYALSHLEDIALLSPLSKIIDTKGLISYWRLISYGLDERHLNGLELFGKYASEIGLL